MRILISIIILLNCITSCNQGVDIAGHWRPADILKTEKETDWERPGFRDLILNSDSTFTAVGSGQMETQIKGWINGYTQKGKWNFSNSTLSLLIEDVSRPVKFKVLKLTDQVMVMESEYMKSIEFRFRKIKS